MKYKNSKIFIPFFIRVYASTKLTASPCLCFDYAQHKSVVKIFLLLLLLMIFNCAPKKDVVSDVDYKRLMERVAIVRLNSNLTTDDSTPTKTDYQILLESCDILRLEHVLVLEKIKSTNPELYSELVGKK